MMRLALLAPAFALCLTWPHPAAAFDCAKATSEVEKAICASPEARDADARMAAAYGALRKLMSDDEARLLRVSQRQWLKWREVTCAWREDSERGICVTAETEQRWRILAGIAKAGPGTGARRLRPTLIARQGDAKTYTIAISGVVFAEPGTPGEKAFNDAVMALAAEAPVNETIDFETAGELFYNLAIEVTYASPDFISALGVGSRYDGGAHENHWTKAVNVDLRTGRALTFADLFVASARPALSAACRDQIVADKRAGSDMTEAAAREDVAVYQDTIDQHVGDLSRWSFDDKRAEINFDPYEVGSYAEGAYSCHFDIAVLCRQANPGAPLPAPATADTIAGCGS